MQLRNLGKSGLQVSPYGYGAWAIGGVMYGDIPEYVAIATINQYLDMGGNFIDTARAYRTSESLLGKALEARNGRSDVILSSKSKYNDEEGLRSDLEESLGNLKTDYIDLYFLHEPPEDPEEMEAALAVMEKFKSEGKIRATGASIKGPDVTDVTVDMCKRYIQSGKVDALQVIYSIFRQRLRPIFSMAEEHGVGIVARTVMESGFLTGKYKPGEKFTGTDHRTRWSDEKLQNILNAVDSLNSTPLPSGYSKLSEVAIRFAVDEPGVSTVILGAKNPQQMEANIRVSELPDLEADYRDMLYEKYCDKTDELNIG